MCDVSRAQRSQGDGNAQACLRQGHAGITNLREAPIRRRKGHHRFETVSAHRQCKPRGQRREEERDEVPELRSAAAPWTEQREPDAVNQESRPLRHMAPPRRLVEREGEARHQADFAATRSCHRSRSCSPEEQPRDTLSHNDNGIRRNGAIGSPAFRRRVRRWCEPCRIALAKPACLHLAASFLLDDLPFGFAKALLARGGLVLAASASRPRMGHVVVHPLA